jgi:hypothetical protein
VRQRATGLEREIAEEEAGFIGEMEDDSYDGVESNT